MGGLWRPTRPNSSENGQLHMSAMMTKVTTRKNRYSRLPKVACQVFYAQLFDALFKPSP